MTLQDLKRKVRDIVKRSTALKNKYIEDKDAIVNYACIFCHSKKEYVELVRLVQQIGKVVEKTSTGLVFHINPIKTVSGVLKLLKIRLPDETRPELGDADFTISNFSYFKKKYIPKKGFKLIQREDFEMIELTDDDFDVRVYFSNPHLDDQLNI